jgi:hypothetical protein
VQLFQIAIDLEIHNLIEQERNGFDEPQYLALRRLLKLPDLEGAPIASRSGEALPWTDQGVIVPHGSRARMAYGRGAQVYEGRFLNGKLVIDGQGYHSLSAAADAVAITKAGRKTSLNGWFYWKVQFPDESLWRSLQEMRAGRKRYRIL